MMGMVLFYISLVRQVSIIMKIKFATIVFIDCWLHHPESELKVVAAIASDSCDAAVFDVVCWLAESAELIIHIHCLE
jgi:hypothetical protein